MRAVHVALLTDEEIARDVEHVILSAASSSQARAQIEAHVVSLGYSVENFVSALNSLLARGSVREIDGGIAGSMLEVVK